MDQAKHAVNNFISKAGHKDTTVHETVAPAVQNETVKEHQREERTTVRDREVHQDHHHTTVQPIHDKEVLPETHHHNLIGTEHRTHDHRDHGHTKEHLANEAAQFKNSSTRVAAQSAHSNAAPEVTGEHVHHHVHERIQPVIHKETIEPHVVHTTVPVHETIHNKAQHHTSSALPAVSIDEFKKGGGVLTGRAERTDHFTGEPHSIDKLGHGHHSHSTGAGQPSGALGRETGHTGTHGATGAAGAAGAAGVAGAAAGHHSGHHTGTTTGTTHTGSHTTGTGHTGSHNTGSGVTGSHTTGTGHNTSHTTDQPKVSLLDKLNPMKDADGDGKKGFMS